MERRDRFTRANNIMSALHSSRKELEQLGEEIEQIDEMTPTHFAREIHSIWDNEGETVDRYTIVLRDGAALGMSDNPEHPQGFSQWDDGVKPGSHLGKKIGWKDLPLKVQKHALGRLKLAFEDVEIKLEDVKIDDPELARKIDEWGKIKEKVQKADAELRRLKKELEPHEKELLPEIEKILIPMEERVAETDKYIITLTRIASTTVKAKYSKAWKVALEKVNENTRNFLKQVLEDTKEVSKVTTSYKAKAKNESIVTTFKNAINSFKRKLKQWANKIKQLDVSIKELKKVVEQAQRDMKESEEVSIEEKKKEKPSKPLDYNELKKEYRGEANAQRSIVEIMIGTRGLRDMTELSQILSDKNKKDSDAVAVDAFGNEISKGAVKEVFRRFLGL